MDSNTFEPGNVEVCQPDVVLCCLVGGLTKFMEIPNNDGFLELNVGGTRCFHGICIN